MRSRQSTRLGFASVMGIVALLAGARVLDAQGSAQGIKVHGHWVIEVRNADGTAHSRREFENALTTGGKQTIASVLGGQSAVAFWRVFTESAASGLCNSSRFCILDEAGSTSGSSDSRNLTKTVVGQTLVLRCSFVATADGAIATVQTVAIPPTGGAGEFTRASLDAPISIQATQSVSITVTFTFS